MKSATERRYINGKKWTKTEREAAQLSVAFLTQKYLVARKFFSLLLRLKLAETFKREPLFGFTYQADKITQRHTFGKYDGTRPERGSRGVDENSISTVPTWFSESVQMDKD